MQVSGRITRHVMFPTLFVVVCGSLAMGAPLSAGLEQATLRKYCTACHSNQNKTGGFSLDPLLSGEMAAHGPEWEKVIRKMRARYMPPSGLPRPDEATYAKVVGSLESAIDSVASTKPNAGRTATFRRLNRAEYRNAIRDLLSIDLDVSALLPPDDASHGFDNVTVGNLSPVLLERYLAAARKISRLAVGNAGRAPGGDTITLPPDLTQEEHFAQLPLGTRGGTVVPYTFPANATYEFQIRLARDRNEHVEGLYGPNQVELLMDGKLAQTFTVAPPKGGGSDHTAVDQHLNVRIPVTAGPHKIAVAFPKLPSALLETERQPYEAHFNMDRHPRIRPAVYSVSINGPFDVQGAGDSPSRKRVFACTPSSNAEEAACASRILAGLAGKAWRRPVTGGDIQGPLKFFRESRQSGASFDESIEMGLRSILVSPEFLFRMEKDPAGVAPGSAYRVDELTLASRLSFFLWSSIPDDELLQAAAAGRLRDPATLDRQVRRMLADPRSQAMIDNFAGQWLYLRNLDSAKPDMRLFPDFDDNLRQAMRRETELLFDSVLREDRNVLDLLRARYTFVNERLAKHYGIPNIYGSRFRRIELDGSQHRGGLLRHASILTITSYATRTSPVIRGKWILDNVLGLPPPPPPGNVPALKEKAASNKPQTMRVRLAEHRENPACAGCHRIMDPVGFTLENYDAIGRWRIREEGAAVDSSGGLPDGVNCANVDELEKALLNRPELFATTFTEKLLTYALGRGVEPFDAPAVRKIVRESQSRDFRFSSFILAIVNSTPFQMRNSQ